MFGFVTFAILGTLVLVTLHLYRNLQQNIKKAKRTGLPYVVSPLWGIGLFWSFLVEILGPLLRKLPVTKSWDWVAITGRQESWTHLRAAEEKYGDAWMVASPNICYLKISNAELGTQITTRRNDFMKPIDRYTIVDLFGKSILTQEGQEWKRHKKIVGPSFSEKSNKLVFEESLRQAEGMMNLWASQGRNTKEDVKVKNTSIDAAVLSLHVISAAGFGVPQLWPGESEDKLQGNGVPGFSSFKLMGEHTLSFKVSLTLLLQRLFWLAPFSPWVLKISPFQVMNEAYRAFHECKIYFNELLELKKRQLYLGESEKGTMDLMGPMIKASNEAPSDSKLDIPQEANLSREEIVGNCFIFLFAGHETTANSIHYTFLHLAMHLAAQRRMQADIDSIVGRDKPISEFSYHTDMPRLYNSMVGAVMNEQMRLIPAILNILKETNGDQEVWIDGKRCLIPDGTLIHLNVVGTNRNPRYWPQSPDEFIPERWLPSQTEKGHAEEHIEAGVVDGLEQTSFETSNSTSLRKPMKGSFISFSEGARACPGRRFAQVEATAVLSAIFQKYSVELDVTEWANDEQLERMGIEEKRAVYGKAIERARNVIRRSEQTITLQMKRGDQLPVRFVARGKEKFGDVL